MPQNPTFKTPENRVLGASLGQGQRSPQTLRGSNPGRDKIFFSALKRPSLHCGPPRLLVREYKGRGVKLTTHLHPVTRWRTRGVIRLIPPTCLHGVDREQFGTDQLKCDGTQAKTRFRLSAKRTSPFQSAGASVQSTTGSRGVRISGSNAGYTMFRGSVKGTGYPFHSPVSPPLPLPCVAACHHISTGLYWPLSTSRRS